MKFNYLPVLVGFLLQIALSQTAQEMQKMKLEYEKMKREQQNSIINQNMITSDTNYESNPNQVNIAPYAKPIIEDTLNIKKIILVMIFL